LACPVYLFFCPKIQGRYRLYFEAFAERVRLPRSTREQELGRYAQAYADRLEHYCRLAPFQWFNFFDFWGNPKDAGDGRK
jgi:predicted LPLAT superfamily acyltransferase